MFMRFFKIQWVPIFSLALIGLNAHAALRSNTFQFDGTQSQFEAISYYTTPSSCISSHQETCSGCGTCYRSEITGYRPVCQSIDYGPCPYPSYGTQCGIETHCESIPEYSDVPYACDTTSTVCDEWSVSYQYIYEADVIFENAEIYKGPPIQMWLGDSHDPAKLHILDDPQRKFLFEVVQRVDTDTERYRVKVNYKIRVVDAEKLRDQIKEFMSKKLFLPRLSFQEVEFQLPKVLDPRLIKVDVHVKKGLYFFFGAKMLEKNYSKATLLSIIPGAEVDTAKIDLRRECVELKPGVHSVSVVMEVNENAFNDRFINASSFRMPLKSWRELVDFGIRLK